MTLGKDKMEKSILIIGVILLIVVSGYTLYESSELKISNIVFCSEKPTGYMKYVEQPDATYKPGDLIYIYYNVNGVNHNKNPDETKETWVTDYITLKTPNGIEVLQTDSRDFHENMPEGSDLNKFSLWIELPTPSEGPTGEYTVDITVIDKISNKEVTETSSFVLS